MTADEMSAGSSEFEQQTRALLLESAERLPGSVRSRLTQARHAALAHSATPSTNFTRRWLPAGALAATALALLVVFIPGGKPALETPVANAGFEDMELLSDSDAVPLNGDQDVDYDFYEWAAGEAAGTPASSVGT